MAPKRLTKKDELVAKVVEEGASHPCSFCHHDVNDEILYGKLYSFGELYCHYFCVLLSCCLIQKGEDEEGLLGFLYTDIKAELERSKKHKCSYCGKEGATLGCVVQQCRKQFHVPCGHKKDAVSLYFGNYKTFCVKHAPRQKIPVHIMEKAKQRLLIERRAKKFQTPLVPDDTVTTSPSKLYDDESPSKPCVCVLCYELVDGYPSPRTFWPSCCGTDQWFHRQCLQRMALTAGMHYLKCPLCNDKESFYQAIMEQGYYVPDRDAAWELDQNAFSDMYERQMECSAVQCICPDGTDRDDDTGDWCITPCLLCGSVGVHNGCRSESRYICHICTPATPADLDRLEEDIARLIQEEQRRKAAAAVAATGPIMPSRMSIRRTKGLVSKRPKPSTSGSTVSTINTHQVINVTQAQEVTNTKLSRIELNLCSPKRRNQFTDITNQKSPMKSIEKNLYDQSPMKIIEESVYARIKQYSFGPNRLKVIHPSKIFEKVKGHMLKPRPLCVKKKIVNKILEDFLLEAGNSTSPLSKTPIRLRISPTKAITPQSKDHSNSWTPTKLPAVKEPSTPKHQEIELKFKQILTSTPQKIEGNPLKDTSLRSPQDIYDDESSASTFQLPQEFIADTLSDDFESPKKTKMADISSNSIEMSDKNSLEKSNLEPDETVILKNNPVFDLDTFKSQYLNEMFKCEFNHNHDKKRKSPKLKTAMSFAVNAAMEKNNQSNSKEFAVKSKLADDKTSKNIKKKRRAKKQEMAPTENNLNLQFDNTDNTGQIKIQYDKPKDERAKKRKKKDKTQLSIRNKNIKLKIKIQEKKFKFKITERKKKKKEVISSPNDLKQSLINFSPQISKPAQNLIPTPIKKVKKEQKNDNFMQTSLHSFFKTESS